MLSWKCEWIERVIAKFKLSCNEESVKYFNSTWQNVVDFQESYVLMTLLTAAKLATFGMLTELCQSRSSF